MSFAILLTSKKGKKNKLPISNRIGFGYNIYLLNRKKYCTSSYNIKIIKCICLGFIFQRHTLGFLYIILLDYVCTSFGTY